MKIKSRNQLLKIDPTQYRKLKETGLLDEIYPYVNKINTLEDCINDAKKYKTVTEWARGKNTKYSSARTRGWIDLCSKHMSKRHVWSLTSCKQSALKYKSKAEWRKNESGAYSAAKKRGWMDKCSKHMKRPASEKKQLVLRSDGKIYSSLTEAMNSGFKGVWQAITYNRKCGGYRWTYCNENGSV